MIKFKKLLFLIIYSISVSFFSNKIISKDIPVGQLVDFTGPTSSVGKPFGQGHIDAIKWINKNGGIKDRKIRVDTVDYSYKAPRAVATYKRWKSRLKVITVIGWGTADTEALMETIARDKVPFYSGSYAGQLTDPTGKAPNSFKAAPYNFFYGPSYSDACRGLVSWALKNWESKGKSGKPKFVHMGDNHPYPNAPKKACQEYAEEIGFEVLAVINYTLAPGDFTAQCLTLKQIKADYAYLANSSNSTTSLLKACNTVGVEVQFMTNVWGVDETVIKASGKAADGVVFAVRTSSVWGENNKGMELVKKVSEMSGKNQTYRSVHYISAVCSMFFIAEAMKIAMSENNFNGEGIRNAMYKNKNWIPEGLDGVCLPSTWKNDDHRGLMEVPIYKVKVNDRTDKKSVDELMSSKVIQLVKEDQITLPRRPEWRGY
ncbi:MAG: branched-chain amino acid ABC transporter substrate-binding protein [Rickettsiales bacterium]|nr:branched-chain amino acid ABC transporter substrate-binding protein [Rickettsiales bacterium]